MSLLFCGLLTLSGGTLGAEKPPHWAFQPVRRPAAPVVRETGWIRGPIDAFILARIEKSGLVPSPEADRAALARRVSLDLLGLPPSPDDVAEFIADDRPDAYERYVDSLLASPHHGERWGRHWLDLARYADSNGYTIDGSRSIWKYRDWVIEALNRDLPFDRFAIEQIAGDMLPEPTLDQLIATGFHRNTLVNEEGGTDPEEFRVEAVVDRVATTGSVFLGLTVGCARCHDHKYDPISQREFYQLFAFFNGADEPQLAVPADEKVKKEEPALVVELAQEEKRLADTETGLAARQADWERQIAGRLAVEWEVLEPLDARSEEGAAAANLGDGSVLFGAAKGEKNGGAGNSRLPDRDAYRIAATAKLERITALRLEALTHASLPSGGPGLAANGNFVLSELSLSAAGARAPFDRAWADHSQKDYPVESAVDGSLMTGWAINVATGKLNVDREAVFVLQEPAAAGPRTRLEFRLEHRHSAPRYALGRLRLSVTGASREIVDLPPSVRRILAKPAGERSNDEAALLAEGYRRIDSERAAVAARVEYLKARLKELRESMTKTLIIRERKEPRTTHIHIRGDFLRKGAEVEPSIPAVLPHMRSSGGRASRLDLARWIVDPENPLTARVAVNRIWQQFFGEGIVATENDFGVQGDAPRNPELLDWLAAEFVSRGWSLKAMHRRIVTSAAYRQSSRLLADLAEKDPMNRLLARQSRLRLEAESVRDAALAASGLLSYEIGGPGVYPPQPEGIYRFTQNVKYWKESQGADRYRRGLYTYFWRSSPHPFLSTFDAPDATTACTRRVRSNTPLQALTLANDRSFYEAAQALGLRILREAPRGDGERIRHAFRLCLARSPTDAELRRLADFLKTERAAFAAVPETARAAVLQEIPLGIEPAEAAAWIAVARVLLNLDEFITRE